MRGSSRCWRVERTGEVRDAVCGGHGDGVVVIFARVWRAWRWVVTMWEGSYVGGRVWRGAERGLQWLERMNWIQVCICYRERKLAIWFEDYTVTMTATTPSSHPPQASRHAQHPLLPNDTGANGFRTRAGAPACLQDCRTWGARSETR